MNDKWKERADKVKNKKHKILQSLKEDNELIDNYSKNILKELNKDLKEQYYSIK